MPESQALPDFLSVDAYRAGLQNILEILNGKKAPPGSHPTDRILTALDEVNRLLSWNEDANRKRQDLAMQVCRETGLYITFRKDGPNVIVTVGGDNVQGSGLSLADAVDAWRRQKEVQPS